ncbi:JmjC domain, hydroxylase-domain-containing protein [Rhodocollybia butyracea]|uniref:[histone H3]-trimethyl-L-lysine(9) demethylase n=1 Tax=Rhodocollybia butyracea TaxID=206335 RepID=A0A9P5Q3K7_9AGAR|nr:JmjC domain, hydroxylase-domain-containing protein [Rhodocollybia butyracea]
MNFMSFGSPTPSLTPSVGTPPPDIPVQPDHFYRLDDSNAFPSSPRSRDGATWYDPEDDRLASRGIPVFKPTMDEFRDFEAYMNRVECWGQYSGIVKVIPPKEWKNALPPLKEQLPSVQIKTPIEQFMLGQTGLFRQQNVEKRKTMSVREWAEFCAQPDYRAPSVAEVGLHARTTVKAKTRRTRKKDPELMRVKEEPVDDAFADSIRTSHSATPGDGEDVKSKPKSNRRQVQKLTEAEKEEKDAAFLEAFDPESGWLPPNTKAQDYTPEFCAKLERHYWRNMGWGKSPWYGADTQGSLYTDETTEWNVAHLESELSRLLPSDSGGLPGVNTPYLYWGMWRATFAWHVEDMDLFSINYIHFGAPKFWYAVPQGRAGALEQTMRSFFPQDTSQCPQFLRHKSFLASPTLLAKSSCKPNTMVQHAGEFIITFPRGYHAGFNLGFNCAESVNFALKSWIELGKVAKACKCIADSVVIDVNQLLANREMENGLGDEVIARKSTSRSKSVPSKPVKQEDVYVLVPPLSKNKRKAPLLTDGQPAAKKQRKSTKRPTITLPASSSQTKPRLSIKLKLGPKPEAEVFPCCLCVSQSNERLLRVHDPPFGRKEALDACSNPAVWMAHEECANIVPETWVDEVESGSSGMQRVVFGVDGIPKDRWNLKCSACTKIRPRAHGAPIQCTRGKCLKAFHVSCARDGQDNNIVFEVLREVEKEVVLLDVNSNPSHSRTQVDGSFNDSGNGAFDHQTQNVLTIIKKVEVQILCSQHNPAVAAARKASKQDKIKSDLLALPPMSRIKLRVSAGVFEVSLVRVIEECGSVEVLWDRGLKKEFKWSSIVFGKTDGPVLQKPSEPAPDLPRTTILSLAPPSSIRPTSIPTIQTNGTSASHNPHPTSTACDHPTYQPQPAPFYGPQPAGTPNPYRNYYASAGNTLAGSASSAASSYPLWKQQYDKLREQVAYASHPVRHVPPMSVPTTFSVPLNSFSRPIAAPLPISNGAIPSQTGTPLSPSHDGSSSPLSELPTPQPSALAHTPSYTSPQSPMPGAVSQSSVPVPIWDFQTLKALPPAHLAQLIHDNAELRSIFQSALAVGGT